MRRITNEKEVTDFLEKRGFTIVYLEEIPPVEQAQVFHQATIVVGPHGSGFANLIFAQIDTKIVEIDHGTTESNDGENRSFYKRFATLMNCIYYPFHVDKVCADQWEDDMTVNMEDFKEFLDKLIPIEAFILS